MKRKSSCIFVITAVIVVFLLLGGCSRTMADVIQTEPKFTGIVTEIEKDCIIVDVHANEELNEEHDFVYVSLEVELKDGITDFDVGDEVTVYYNGKVLDKAAGAVDTVYAILLRTPANKDKNNVS